MFHSSHSLPLSAHFHNYRYTFSKLNILGNNRQAPNKVNVFVEFNGSTHQGKKKKTHLTVGVLDARTGNRQCRLRAQCLWEDKD